MAVLRCASDPLAVADDQVAEFALGVEFVEKAVGVAGPGHEFELHVDIGLGGEILGQFDQRVCRVPGGPAQGQLFGLGRIRQCRRQGKHRGEPEKGFQFHLHEFLPELKSRLPASVETVSTSMNAHMNSSRVMFSNMFSE
ncbi:hypothetical protein D3C71_1767110 [compost metagenome]